MRTKTTRTHVKLYTLLSKSLPFNQVVKIGEIFPLGQYAFVTEKEKHSTLPENERPKYVIIFNEPSAAGRNGQVSFATTVLKYQANQWAKPIKTKYSSEYVIKSINLGNPGNAINANLELSFNNALNGPTFLPLMDDKTYYMPLKRQPGRTLHDLICILKEDPNFLTPLQYYALAKSLIEDLAHIHEKNLLHCDIKPNNILVDLDKLSMRLVDYGLMKKVDTYTGFRGTPKYADPACLSGEIVQDKISDVYSAVLCLLELFGEYEHNENIHIHRICANINKIPQHEITRIQQTLHDYSRHSRELRESNLQSLNEIFTALMQTRILSDKVSIYEKINSTLTLSVIERLGFDTVMANINNQIHSLNISVIEILIQHGLKLDETYALSDALRLPNITLFKVRRLHELGARFNDGDFIYWLNERPIETNNLQVWAEICLYLYEAFDYPQITAIISSNECEEKCVFLNIFLNSQTLWQDSAIDKKIKQQIASNQALQQLTYYNPTHFDTLINEDIKKNPSMNVVQMNVALRQRYTSLLNECQKLVQTEPESPMIPSVKQLEANISATLADTTIKSLGKYVIKLNAFTKTLNQYSKALHLLAKVSIITTIPFNTLKIADINYCVTLHDAATNINWFIKKAPPLISPYILDLQSFCIDAIAKFKPGNSDLISLAPLFQLATLKTILEKFEQLDDNAGIKELVISEFPLLLSSITNDNIENITLSYQSLLENLMKSVEPQIHRYKADMFSDITHIYPDNMGLILNRLKRYHTLSKAIIKFLEKMEFSYMVLKNTPVIERLQVETDELIKEVLIDPQNTITNLNNLLTKTRLLERIAIESDEYTTNWHQAILLYSVHHILTKQDHENKLTLAGYHQIQKNVTFYLSTNATPNPRILECVITYIENNDIDLANKLLNSHKKRGPQSLFFVKEAPVPKKQRTLLPFDI